MQPGRLKRSAMRIVGIAALAAALLTQGGIAGATPRDVGLTACDAEGCSVVTMRDLAIKRGSVEMPEQPVRPLDPIGFTE